MTEEKRSRTQDNQDTCIVCYVLMLFVCCFLSFVLFSCKAQEALCAPVGPEEIATAPQSLDGTASAEGALSAQEPDHAGTPESSRVRSDGDMLYSLTRTGLDARDEAGTAAPSLVPSIEVRDTSAGDAGDAGGAVGSRGARRTTAARVSELTGIPYPLLLEEIYRRLEDDWEASAGGLGPSGEPSAADRVEDHAQASRRLIALGLLLEDRGVSGEALRAREALRSALAFATAKDAAPEDRLLAATYWIQTGRLEEAAAILEDLFPRPPLPARAVGDAVPPQTPEAPGLQSSFHLASLALARSVDGPGKYLPAAADSVSPVKTILIYGEFRSFRALREVGEDDAQPVYRRSFAASLRLLTAAGAQVDALHFLPEGRGVQVAENQDDMVNFWARYTIPEDLESGQYKIVIDGRDLIGGSSASAELALSVARRRVSGPAR